MPRFGRCGRLRGVPVEAAAKLRRARGGQSSLEVPGAGRSGRSSIGLAQPLRGWPESVRGLCLRYAGVVCPTP